MFPANGPLTHPGAKDEDPIADEAICRRWGT